MVSFIDKMKVKNTHNNDAMKEEYNIQQEYKNDLRVCMRKSKTKNKM